jgi:PAS domain S-box-containing protein
MTPRTSERTAPAKEASETVVERRLPSEPRAAAAARRALDLIGSGLAPPLLDNAKLLVSELVTNAVRHGPHRAGAEVRLRAAVEQDVVRVDVTDDGHGFEPPPASGFLDVGGWGLVLVDRVADRWGVEDGGHTRVWFELDRTQPPASDRYGLSSELDTLQIALDAGRMGTWDWDLPSGTVRWSETLEQIHGLEPGTFGGSFDDFQADMHPEDRARVVGTIERAVRQERDCSTDYRINRRSDGAIRWVTLRGRVLHDEVGRPRGMAGVCADITERKVAERSLALQYAVARVLSTAPTVEEATPVLVESIAEALGGEGGALWRLDEDAGVLRCIGGWSANPSGKRFVAKTREFLFESGIGLPGRVWSTGRPAWIPDIGRDDNFPRAPFALDAGLHDAFAFPISLGGVVLGVMEVYSRRIREPDEGLLELMSAIGAQVGQYLERKTAEAELVESEARKSAVLESALEAIITMDEHGRIVELNAAAAEMFGHDREEAVGRDLAELIIPPGLRERHREGLRRYQRAGRGRILSRRLELFGMRADGSEFPVELTITRVQLPDPQPALFTGYIRDITPRRRAEELQARLFESERAAREQAEEAREQAEMLHEQAEKARERLAFLADASVTLASSLDVRKTLAKVTRLSVPRIADWCRIDLVERDGSIQPVDVHHVDPEKVALARRYQERYPPQFADPAGASVSIESGQAQLYPEYTPEMLEARFPDPEQRASLLELGLRSEMIVPLVARGRTLGAITFASAGSGRTFARDDLELAEAVARRAAPAIDNARMYEERSHIARTLQKTLLPHRLPEIPGLEVEAYHQPAGVTQAGVGGDFYDVFEAGEGAWGVVVGDVCGKGVEAAALTGMARHTLRASAMREASPQGTLRDLNRVMLRENGERFCTVALARVEANGGGVSLTVACGGHPSPLVLRGGGAVEQVGAPGSLLGVFEDVEFEDRAVELAPGDLAVFFTDGLVDPRHPTPLGERELRSLVGSCAGLTAQESVDRIREAVADPGAQAPDDVCILALRVDSVGAAER